MWFIYQLKHDTAWAKGSRAFFRILPKECGFLAIMLFLPASMPIVLQKKSSGILHFRRNMYWFVRNIDELRKRTEALQVPRIRYACAPAELGHVRERQREELGITLHSLEVHPGGRIRHQGRRASV